MKIRGQGFVGRQLHDRFRSDARLSNVCRVSGRILAQHAPDEMVRNKNDEGTIILIIKLLRDVGSLLYEESVARVSVKFPGSQRPLLAASEDILDIVVVRPVTHPVIRDQAFVLDEKKIVNFKFPEEVAMDDIVVKVKHDPRNSHSNGPLSHT